MEQNKIWEIHKTWSILRPIIQIINENMCQ